MDEPSTKRLSEVFREAGLIDRVGDSIPGLVYVFDLVERRNVFTNRQLADLLGYSPEQVGAMGDRVLGIVIHPDDLPGALRHHVAMASLADHQVVEIEYRVRTPGGDWRWLHSWESVLTRGEDGRPRMFLGIAHDVSPRVRAEDDLRESERRQAESEQRWRSIAENPFDFVVVIDRDYKYTYVNFVAPGVERDALLGKATPFDFVSKDDHAVMKAAFERVFNEGRATSYDVYVPTMDKWYASLVGPIRDGDVVTHASVLTREITAEKRSQEQARQAEIQVRSMELKLAQSAKLEAVGQLAGGIAHDFNNLLTGIAGLTDLLADRFEPGDPSQEDVSDLRSAIARGAGLARQLLTFSRQQPVTLTEIDVPQLLDESIRMLRRVIPENVELDVVKPSRALFTRADRTQLEQVLLNLALNARDAMPRGGRLHLSLAAVEIGEESRHEVPEVRPGSYVQVRLQDTGTGMDADTLARIFEPFFTTKPIGAGTGLGLAVVHGIVKQSGGFIRVRSVLGQGSTFEIHLPEVERGEVLPATPTHPRRGGIETVLLVEDDALARRITTKLLELLGYTVRCEERGDSALRRIESGLAFDLLLTDVLLPGLDGHTLAARARLLRPDLRVVFMSGYTADVFADKGWGELGASFLAKPFSQDELADRLRAALDAPRA